MQQANGKSAPSSKQPSSADQKPAGKAVKKAVQKDTGPKAIKQDVKKEEEGKEPAIKQDVKKEEEGKEPSTPVKKKPRAKTVYELPGQTKDTPEEVGHPTFWKVSSHITSPYSLLVYASCKVTILQLCCLEACCCDLCQGLVQQFREPISENLVVSRAEHLVMLFENESNYALIKSYYMTHCISDYLSLVT